MPQFKQFISQVNGLQYVYENVNVCSPLGKSLLLESCFQNDKAAIEHEFDCIDRHISFLKQHPKESQQLILLLHELNDISQTITNLKRLQTLDDIELFEVKQFAMASQKILELLQQAGYENELPNDLSKAIRILDPEGSRIAHFYIYAVYDERLAGLRRQIAQTDDADEREQLTWQCAQVEDQVRQKLTEMLHPYWEALSRNKLILSVIDLHNAKAQMAMEWHLCRPALSNEQTSYRAIFNPQLQHQLKERGGAYQAVDITLQSEPCLITGANMSGKTVLLKALSLAQHLCQFGFFVPAEEATIRLADDIFCIIDDKQNEQHGLSSFAVEILNINRIIENIKSGKHPFVLVDELARTTNPDEGRRIVNAFVTMMERYQVMSLVTTHYGGIENPCRRLRVKGLRMSELTDSVTPQNLHRYMDYSLVETTSREVPTEALTIARVFHADSEFLALTEE